MPRVALVSRTLTTTLTACVLALGLAACDSSSGDGDSSSDSTSSGEESTTGEPDPVPTGADCDPDNTLTYENFGEAFIDDYCGLCHKSTVTGEDRGGAPEGVDYDTKELVQMLKADIDSYAGASGDIVNTLMPPQDVVSLQQPTLTERENLAAWLACGAP